MKLTKITALETLNKGDYVLIHETYLRVATVSIYTVIDVGERFITIKDRDNNLSYINQSDLDKGIRVNEICLIELPIKT